MLSIKVIRKSDNKIYALKRVKIGKMSKKEISDVRKLIVMNLLIYDVI